MWALEHRWSWCSTRATREPKPHGSRELHGKAPKLLLAPGRPHAATAESHGKAGTGVAMSLAEMGRGC